MRRRALLAALGAAAAGCVGAPAGSTDETTDGASAGASGGNWTTRTETETTSTETRAETPTPDPDRVALAASPESAALPTATVEFTLRNDANTTFASNFYGWSLAKRTEDGWENVAPRPIPQPLHLLPPGESHTWTLTVDNTEPVTDDGWTNAYGDEEIAYSGFGPGTYRFGIDGWFERDGESSHHRSYAATFELTGDPLALRPEPSVTTRREGSTLIVETADYDSAPSGLRVTATPAPDHDGEVRRPDIERAFRYVGLRNTLPFFEREGVERVRLLAPDATFVVPGGDGAVHVEYGGTVYRIEAAEIEKGMETTET